MVYSLHNKDRRYVHTHRTQENKREGEGGREEWRGGMKEREAEREGEGGGREEGGREGRMEQENDKST